MIRSGFLDLRGLSELEYRALVLQQISALVAAVEKLREDVHALASDGRRSTDCGDPGTDAAGVRRLSEPSEAPEEEQIDIEELAGRTQSLLLPQDSA